MQRNAIARLLQLRTFAAVPIGGVDTVLHFTEEELHGKQRAPPRNYAKREKIPVQPFKETNQEVPEKRTIRTRPRRRDYTHHIRELSSYVDWSEREVTLGKYVQFPQYDPMRRDLEDGNIDLECLPDTVEFQNPFTRQVERIDFSILPTDKEDQSKEAKALRWTEENVPLRDEDLPFALRNPEIREWILKQAIGPNARPKDIWKIWNMQLPTAMEIDPWIVEQYRKLPEVKGKKTNAIQLIAHPRTLKAALKLLKITKPTAVEGHFPASFFEELSEQLLKGTFEPEKEIEDPPNPYRMEDYDSESVSVPKLDPDDVHGLQ